MPKCHNCNSTNLNFYKVIGYGPTEGIVYHYKVECKDCGKKNFIKKTLYIEKVTSKQEWRQSKSFINHANQQTLF